MFLAMTKPKLISLEWKCNYMLVHGQSISIIRSEDKPTTGPFT